MPLFPGLWGLFGPWRSSQAALGQGGCVGHTWCGLYLPSAAAASLPGAKMCQWWQELSWGTALTVPLLRWGELRAGMCPEFEAPVIFKLCAVIYVSNSNSSTGNHLSVFLFFSKIKSKSMKAKFQLPPHPAPPMFRLVDVCREVDSL